MRRTAKAVVALLLLLVASNSFAAPPSKPPGKGIARIDGPIKISAAHAELQQREVALYTGNVTLTSSELTLTGDRLELRQPVRGQFEAHLVGTPARLRHAAVGDAPPMAATAADIVYDTRAAQVDLSGGVQLERGTDVLTSDSLHYDVAARRISASGVGKGQVEMTIEAPAGTLPQEKKPALPQNGAPVSAPPKPALTKRKGP